MAAKSWKREANHVQAVAPWGTLQPTAGPTSSHERINVADIRTAGYQRKLEEPKVRRMVREWNVSPTIIGHIILSLRANGMLFVVDGQHRVEAVKRMQGRVNPYLDAIVWEGLSVGDEAEMFWKTQSPKMRKALSPEDIHNAAVYAGDDQAIEIAKIVDASGFRLGQSDFDDTHRGRIHAIKVLADVYELYGPFVLAETLAFIGDAWGTAHSPERILISGVSLFLSMYPGADKRSLTRRLSKELQGDWMMRSKSRASGFGFNSTESIAAVLHSDYNRNRPKNRLENFEDSLHKHKAENRTRAAKIGRSKQLAK